jgi:hypothetical protein
MEKIVRDLFYDTVPAFQPDLATDIKINRLKWAGHVIRMDSN